MVCQFAGYEMDLSRCIGIGPLKREYSTDQAMRMMYNPLRYSFQLFFENYYVEIVSDRLSTIGLKDDQLKNNHEILTQFEQCYRDLRVVISQKIWRKWKEEEKE